MILHNHKLIFIHIPKCAGSSISTLFNVFGDHCTAHDYEIEYPQYWDSYKKFTIVRHPLDRIVSLYHYTIINPYGLRTPAQVLAYKGFRPWLLKSIERYGGDFSFYSVEGARNTQGAVGSSFWFSSQVRRLTDMWGNVYPDINIFKLEDGIEKVTGFLNKATGKELIVPHENKTEHNHFLSYYDKDLFDIVSNFAPIKEDCEKLGYKLTNYDKRK